MRILHTSDWHLGVLTGAASRSEEQERFLGWLHLALREHEVDALVMAGDVFDSMQPSAEAQGLYFRFLAQLGDCGVRDVVVVGGNHDSAARLDAPRALLEAVGVHVVGGVPPAGEPRGHLIAPLRRRGSDEVAAACLAVPYVHEYRLGVRTTDPDPERTRREFKEAFSRLYATLADEAEERFPGVPLLATGHLTMGAVASREDAPREIHRVGTLEGLPGEILDPRLRYAALGHIHRAYPIAGTCARYCGSPLPYSVHEMATPRRVLLVDLDEAGAVEVQPLLVPLQRELVQLVGPSDAVLQELATLRWDAPLPPLVHVRAITSLCDPGLPDRLAEAVASHPEAARPVLVELQQRAEAIDRPEAAPQPSLQELRPEQVFELICDGRGLEGEERGRLLGAFRSLASADPTTLQRMIDDVPLPPTEGRRP